MSFKLVSFFYIYTQYIISSHCIGSGNDSPHSVNMLRGMIHYSTDPPTSPPVPPVTLRKHTRRIFVTHGLLLTAATVHFIINCSLWSLQHILSRVIIAWRSPVPLQGHTKQHRLFILDSVVTVYQWKPRNTCIHARRHYHILATTALIVERRADF